MPRAKHGCHVGLEDLPHEELLAYALGAEKHIGELDERIGWLTMRGTDELPRNDFEGNRICEELTGDALVEYLRAQRRSERDRAEMAERVASACDHNIMGVRAELLESKKTASALQNRLAATDRNSADLRAKLAEAERERDEAKKALAQVLYHELLEVSYNDTIENLTHERDELKAEIERLKGAVAEMTRDLRKLADDDNLPASSAAVVAMARIQALERAYNPLISQGAGADDLYSYPDEIEQPEGPK